MGKQIANNLLLQRSQPPRKVLTLRITPELMLYIYDIHVENRHHINGLGPLHLPAVINVKRCD